MPGTPTACHAFNLFSLTMESRFGGAWRMCVAPETIANLAHEIAAGFGGQRDGAAPTDGDDTVVWRFPDGSRAWTGRFGLRREETEQAA